MEVALQFFRAYEIWIYLILGFGGIFYIRKFILAWQELQATTFGLERESAQGRLNSAAAVLVLLLALVMVEFVLVSFIAPATPGAIPLLTPTLDLLATPTTTLAPTPSPLGGTPPAITATLPAQPVAPVGNACIPGQVVITFPQEGGQISGIVEILGTVNIPNFGFYKLEMKRPEETTWLTILAGNEIKQEAVLGAWNTSLLPPGNYQLSLVAVDNQGASQAPCIVQINIASPEGTPGP